MHMNKTLACSLMLAVTLGLAACDKSADEKAEDAQESAQDARESMNDARESANDAARESNEAAQKRLEENRDYPSGTAPVTPATPAAPGTGTGTQQ
jgi:hypothetical protein